MIGTIRLGRISDWLRRACFALGFATVLTGCRGDVADFASVLRLFGDSPTTFEQAGPIAVATSENSVIFKSPTESNNCMLLGGTVSLTATKPQLPLRATIRVSYTHVRATKRNDILRIGAGADGLAVNGRGQYRFEPAATLSPWQSLQALPPGGVHHLAGERVITSIRPGPNGQYKVAMVTSGDAKHGSLFRGTVLPTNGVVYMRDAMLSNVASAFAGRSEHDCGNWNSASEATAALGRVQAHWPSRSAHDN